MRPVDTTGEPGRIFPTVMKTTNKTLFVVLPLAAAVNAAWAQAASDEYTTLDTSVVSAAGYSQGRARSARERLGDPRPRTADKTRA